MIIIYQLIIDKLRAVKDLEPREIKPSVLLLHLHQYVTNYLPLLILFKYLLDSLYSFGEIVK